LVLLMQNSDELASARLGSEVHLEGLSRQLLTVSTLAAN